MDNMFRRASLRNDELCLTLLNYVSHPTLFATSRFLFNVQGTRSQREAMLTRRTDFLTEQQQLHP